MGHLGADPDCVICKEATGTMRYIRRTVDPHRETRVAFTFVLDMLVVNARDRFGFKYALVLKCAASSAYRLIHLYLKSDAQTALQEWITELRASPNFPTCHTTHALTSTRIKMERGLNAIEVFRNPWPVWGSSCRMRPRTGTSALTLWLSAPLPSSKWS